MNILESLFQRINGEQRTFFERLDEKAFIQLQKLSVLVPEDKTPIFLLYKLARPLSALKIETDNVRQLSIGRLHYLCTGKFHFGYLFEFPLYSTVSGANFFGISRKKELDPDTVDVSLELTDNYINLFSSGDDALLITDNRELWVERAGYHGKRSSSK